MDHRSWLLSRAPTIGLAKPVTLNAAMVSEPIMDRRAPAQSTICTPMPPGSAWGTSTCGIVCEGARARGEGTRSFGLAARLQP